MTRATVKDSTTGLGQTLRTERPLVGGLSFPGVSGAVQEFTGTQAAKRNSRLRACDGSRCRPGSIALGIGQLLVIHTPWVAFDPKNKQKTKTKTQTKTKRKKKKKRKSKSKKTKTNTRTNERTNERTNNNQRAHYTSHNNQQTTNNKQQTTNHKQNNHKQQTTTTNNQACASNRSKISSPLPVCRSLSTEFPHIAGAMT